MRYQKLTELCTKCPHRSTTDSTTSPPHHLAAALPLISIGRTLRPFAPDHHFAGDGSWERAAAGAGARVASAVAKDLHEHVRAAVDDLSGAAHACAGIVLN